MIFNYSMIMFRYTMFKLSLWVSKIAKHLMEICSQICSHFSSRLPEAYSHRKLTLTSSWRDRITFILLFGIATSVDLFHDKLPRSSLRCLHGAKFDVARVEESLESVFIATTARTNSQTLWLGSLLSKTLLERQRDHVQSVQAFLMALKVRV